MKLLPFFLLASTLSLVHTASASRPNYTYLGAGYAHERVKGDCKHDGLFLQGSLVLDELWFMQLEHADLTSRSWCGMTNSAVSGGLRSNIGGSSSIYATGALLYRDYGFHSEFGVDVQTGIRSRLSPVIEATAFVGYESVDSFEISYVGGGVNYWLSRELSVMTNLIGNDNNGTGVTVTLRYTF